MTSSVKFQRGKKQRAELKLPQLHFIVMDDWVDKLGNDAYVAWLKFYTWADRTEPDRENDAIPTSMTKIIDKLKTNRKAFYNKVIRPLWNYGLIDLQEFKMGNNTFVNVIVYEYPQNDRSKETLPLEQVRDYDTDYKPQERAMKAKRGVSQRNTPLFPRETPPCFPEKHPPVSQRNTIMYLNQSNNDSEYLKANLLEYLSNLSNEQVSQKVKDWLSKQVVNDRLTDGKLKSICDLYFELKGIHDFSDVEFLAVCNNVLDYPSRNFKKYLKTSLEKTFEQTAQNRTAEQEDTTAKDTALTSHPAYAFVIPIIKKLKSRDYPFAIRNQMLCEAIEEGLSSTYKEAQDQLKELISLGFNV